MGSRFKAIVNVGMMSVVRPKQGGRNLGDELHPRWRRRFERLLDEVLEYCRRWCELAG